MQQNGEALKVMRPNQDRVPGSSGVRRSEALAALIVVLVVAIWLLASWTASAAEIVLSATADSVSNGRATVTTTYTSNGVTGSMMRLYVDGKRWGSSDSTNGAWQVPDLTVGTHKFFVRADGASPLRSNEVRLTITSVAPAGDAKRRDAARLLLQASFGARSVADIDDVKARGNAAWIDAQFNMAWQTHAAYLARLRDQSIKVEEQHIFEAIWQNMIFGDARLRSRVALALTEILVVSNIAPDQDTDALAFWMDTIYKNAFGNYRTLLRDVTLQPAMGYYLNVLGNDKEDPATGRMPSENYAREVMQLFSIGLVQLNNDGTPKRDEFGRTQVTYDQSIVQGFAKSVHRMEFWR